MAFYNNKTDKYEIVLSLGHDDYWALVQKGAPDRKTPEAVAQRVIEDHHFSTGQVDRALSMFKMPDDFPGMVDPA